MTLRRPLTLALLGLMVIAVSASGALVALTTGLHRITREVGTAMENVQVAEESLVDLRAIDAITARLGGADADEFRDAAAHRAATLLDRLGALTDRALRPDEGAALRDASAAVERYLDLLPIGGDTPPAVAGDVRHSEAFEAARVALRRFIEINSARARNARASAARFDDAANGWGLGTAALVVLGTAGILALMQRRLFGPMLTIGGSIVRYGQGHRSSRAPEVGPHEIRGVARAFNGLVEQLERQRSDQLAFLAGVAHDLRNPLSAMRLATRALSADGVDRERARSKLDVLERQVGRLDRLATDFLDAARAEAGQLQLALDVHDLRDLAKGVAELFSSNPSHPVRLVGTGEPLVACCDAGRVEQVLNNLVSNAIKYSPDGGPVEISAERRGGEGVLAVTDRGVGIGDEDLEQIFEPFRRGRRLTSAIPGLGIGLATSRKIAELHGGRLTVKSTSRRGSTFEFAIPLTLPHAERRP